MTLTEFLLARIAEDEAASVNWACDCDLEDLPLEHGWSCRERVMAECQAKRLVVAALGDHWDGLVWDTGTGFRAESALEALALSYATHPDFDPAWSVTAAS